MKRNLVWPVVLCATVMGTADGQVAVSGTVPDDATRSAIVQRLRALYGADAVTDRLVVAPVLAPPGWSAQVQRLLGPGLQTVGKGELKVEGATVAVRGEVASDTARAQAGKDLAAAMTPGFTLHTALRVAPGQKLLDAVLAQRIIEFDSGRATLRPSGMAILDEMAAVILQLKGARIEVSGHTDNVGQRAANVALSEARAQAVRAYLAQKGVAPESVAVSGLGPDRPVADNATADGRARNRRIEFKVAG
ncbi:MAG: OmpA family protein [Burkholderiaceae bacterium]|nr:OmpA family protein [Burkholderiaceae bacterium]